MAFLQSIIHNPKSAILLCYNPILIMATRRNTTQRGNKIPLWLWIFFGFLIVIVVAVGAGFGILLGYKYNLPQIQSLEDYRPDVITDVYSDDNKVIGEFAIERRIIISYDEIPPYLAAGNPCGRRFPILQPFRHQLFLQYPSLLPRPGQDAHGGGSQYHHPAACAHAAGQLRKDRRSENQRTAGRMEN